VQSDGGVLADVDVVLQQTDMLENENMHDVIILQSVLYEVRSQNMRTYTRVRQLIADTSRRFFVFCNQHHKDTFVDMTSGETSRTYVDRTIRVAARWYAMHLGTSSRQRQRRVLVLTNRESALAPYAAEHIAATTVHAYVTDFAPELADVVVRAADADDDADARDEPRDGTAATLYAQHLTLAEIEAGVKSGDLVQGKLRMNRNNATEACVEMHGRRANDAVDKLADDDDDFVVSGVLVQGAAALNRATDGACAANASCVLFV
jgi:exosome complex exonuclease DIS3/RRP44